MSDTDVTEHKALGRRFEGCILSDKGMSVIDFPQTGGALWFLDDEGKDYITSPIIHVIADEFAAPRVDADQRPAPFSESDFNLGEGSRVIDRSPFVDDE